MSTSPREADLWLSVCKGSIDAFNLLFKEHHRSLCISALVILKNEKIAEDIVQDVFLKVWTKKEEIKDINNIVGYLYTSVRNACFDELRKTRFTEDIIEVELSDQALDPFHSVQIKELGKHLKEASESLPGQCREIFELVHIDGKKYQEVADQLGISINTVKTQLKRALVKMRGIMEKYR